MTKLQESKLREFKKLDERTYLNKAELEAYTEIGFDLGYLEEQFKRLNYDIELYKQWLKGELKAYIVGNQICKKLISKIAAFVVATVILNQTDDNYCVTYNEIEKQFPSLEKTDWINDYSFLQGVVDHINEHYSEQFVEISQIEICHNCFDCVAMFNGIAYEGNGEE